MVFKIKIKKAIELDMLGWWILGLVMFIIVVIGILMITGKGSEALSYIKNLFSFR